MALRDDTHDVERLFRMLVEVLAEQEGPARLRRPVHVAEIYQQLVPYKHCREQLGIDANEDYEMAVLRMLAGEGGFAQVLPDEARAMLAEEADAPNPDPTLIRDYAAADVVLDQGHVRRVLQRDSEFMEDMGDMGDVGDVGDDEAPAGPAFTLEHGAPDAAPEPEPEPIAVPPPSPRVTGGTCKSCGRTLPLHRQVIYCPFCGKPAGVRACRECGEELETGWRFCVVCGATPDR